MAIGQVGSILEMIQVTACAQLEEIVAKACDEYEEEKEEEGMDTTKITFPKLRVLEQFGLPELNTICSNSKAIVCILLK